MFYTSAHTKHVANTQCFAAYVCSYSILHCELGSVVLTCVVQEGKTVLHISSRKGDVGMTKFILEQFNPNLEAVEQVC